MRMITIAFLLIVVVMVLVTLKFAGATSRTTFTNGNSVENLTYPSASNITRYVAVYGNSSVRNTSLDLKGFNNAESDQEKNYVSVSSFTDPNNVHDENWETYGNGQSIAFFINYTPVGRTNFTLNYSAKLNGYCYSGQSYFQIYNYTSSSWKTFNNKIISAATNQILGNTTHISSNEATDFTSGDVLKIYYYILSAYSCVFRFYEDKVVWDYVSVENVSVDVGGDGWDYINNSVFDGSINNLDVNASAFNTYLDSCSLNGSGWCSVPIKFESESAGVLQVSDVNITYYTRPTAYPTSVTQSLNRSQSYLFNLTLTPSQANADKLNFSFSTNLSNSGNFTVRFVPSSFLILNAANYTTVNVTVNATASNLTHTFNITYKREIDDKNWSIPTTISVTFSGAGNIIFVQTGTWTANIENDDTVSNSWEINNTGSRTLTSCNSSLSGGLSSYATYHPANGFTLAVGNRTNLSVTITEPVAGVYSSRLSITCVATVEGGIDTTLTNPLLSFGVTSAVTAAGGSGGGGMPLIVVNESLAPIIDFTIPSVDFTVFETDKIKVVTKKIRIFNVGNTFFDGRINLSTGLQQVLEAQVCSIDDGECSSSEANIMEGGSAFLKLILTVTPKIGSGLEGVFSMTNDGDGSKFELPITVSRPPAYKAYGWLNSVTGIGELPAMALVYLSIGFVLWSLAWGLTKNPLW